LNIILHKKKGHTAGIIYINVNLDDYTVGEAFLSELIYNSMFIFVILRVTSPLLSGNQFYAMCIGMTILVAAYSIGGVSGASLNPAVYLGTVLSAIADPHNPTIQTKGTWLYFAAPILAAFFASYLDHLVNKYHEPSPADNTNTKHRNEDKLKPLLIED
jgi:glycerol uptake facilitator-like aquaporin